MAQSPTRPARTALYLLSLLAFITACSSGKTPPDTAQNQDTAVNTLDCPRVSGPIVVDGVIEDAWSGAGTLVLDDPADVADPNGVHISILWDSDYLYVAYRVADKYLVGYQTERDHKALYKDDMIEVLLDPRQDRTDMWLEDDIVYHVNLLGQVKDDRGTPEGRSDATWTSQALFAATVDGTIDDGSDTDRGFCVELAVPWDEIGKTPEAGVRLGINFASGDAEGPDEHLWDWCGARPFRQPSVYGTLVLTER